MYAIVILTHNNNNNTCGRGWLGTVTAERSHLVLHTQHVNHVQLLVSAVSPETLPHFLVQLLGKRLHDKLIYTPNNQTAEVSSFT